MLWYKTRGLNCNLVRPDRLEQRTAVRGREKLAFVQTATASCWRLCSSRAPCSVFHLGTARTGTGGTVLQVASVLAWRGSRLVALSFSYTLCVSQLAIPEHSFRYVILVLLTQANLTTCWICRVSALSATTTLRSCNF